MTRAQLSRLDLVRTMVRKKPSFAAGYGIASVVPRNAACQGAKRDRTSARRPDERSLTQQGRSAASEPPGIGNGGCRRRSTGSIQGGRGRTGQSGPSRQDRCTPTPRDTRPSRDDQGRSKRVLVVVRARGRSRRPALTRGTRSTCHARPSRPLRTPRLSERSGTRGSAGASSRRRGLARSRGCVPRHSAAPPLTA